MHEVSFTLPIYFVKHFKTKPSKTVLLGMNWFRNAHYFDQNKFKQEFTDLVLEQLDSTVISSPFELEMKLHYKNANCDPSNVVALIEKVALDALQKSNTIEEDNVKHHKGTSWTVESQDRKNPRCEITIRSLNDHTSN